jgi:prepilin-type N-terminal cleavage/methylation domain-containing protein
MSRTRPRSGLTLVEVLIVLGVFAILLALFLIARQRIFESAYRTQCQNNLKQLVLAVHNYAATYGNKLPAAYSAPTTELLLGNPAKPTPVQHPQSFFFAIVPYIESNPVYRAGMSKASPPGLTWMGPDFGGPIWSSCFFLTFVCPADPTNSRTQPTACGWFGSSYAANYQVFGTEDWKPKYKLGEIPDGTANTVFIADRFAQYPGRAGQFTDPDGRLQQAYNLWAWPANYPPNPPTAYTSPVPQNAAIFAYHNSKNGQGYGEVAFSPPQIGVRPFEADYRLVQSGHSAMVQVGMGDGSTRGVNVHLSQAVWRLALMPDDGLPGLGDW